MVVLLPICSVSRQQVKEELARGMTPMPHMNAKDERVQCLLEISFIDAVVLPLWEHLALLFPALKPCLDQIVINRTGFQRLTARRTISIKQVTPHSSQVAHISQ